MINLNQKIMKYLNFLKLLEFIIILSIFTISWEKDRESDDLSALSNDTKDVNACDYTVDMIAGQFMDVGEVTAEINGT